MKIARTAKIAAWYVYMPCVGMALLAVPVMSEDLSRELGRWMPLALILGVPALRCIQLRPPKFVDRGRRTDPLDNLGMAGACLPLGGVMLATLVPMTLAALVAVLAPLTIVGTCLIVFSAVKRTEMFFAADASIQTTRQTGREVL